MFLQPESDSPQGAVKSATFDTRQVVQTRQAEHRILQIPSDEDLMADIREGEVRKLAVLFDQHHAGLFRYAMKMTGNSSWIRDDPHHSWKTNVIHHSEWVHSAYISLKPES